MVAVLDFPVTWNNSCRDSGPGGDGVCLPRSALGVPGSWAHAFAHRRWRSMRQWTFLGRTAHRSLGFDRAHGRPIKPTLLSSDRVTPHTFLSTVPLRERTEVSLGGAHTSCAHVRRQGLRGDPSPASTFPTTPAMPQHYHHYSKLRSSPHLQGSSYLRNSASTLHHVHDHNYNHHHYHDSPPTAERTHSRTVLTETGSGG